MQIAVCSGTQMITPSSSARFFPPFSPHRIILSLGSTPFLNPNSLRFGNS